MTVTAPSDSIRFPRSLEREDWELLLSKIEDRDCVPCLGSDVSPSTLHQVAATWAGQYKFPLDVSNEANYLARVAQYLAVTRDRSFPKKEMQKLLQRASPPDFKDPEEPHVVLAELPLPLYITTNYDDYMYRALEARPARDKRPAQGLCLWNESAASEGSGIARDFDPRKKEAVANPLVYHLHGRAGVPNSLALTEDDYLDFLIRFTQDQSVTLSADDQDGRDAVKPVIDLRVVRKLGEASLLLLGYKLNDWDLRVLLRVLDNFTDRNQSVHMAVQLPPFGETATPEQKRGAVRYLDKYFGQRHVKVYWGTSREFISELKRKRAIFLKEGRLRDEDE